jgi:hypothetical protein
VYRTPQVDTEDPLQFLGAELIKRRHPTEHARIIDKDIDFAEFSLDGLGECIHGVLVSDVDSERFMSRSRSRRNAFYGLPRGVHIDVARHHRTSPVRQFYGQSAPDAGPGAGHYRDFLG